MLPVFFVKVITDFTMIFCMAAMIIIMVGMIFCQSRKVMLK